MLFQETFLIATDTTLSAAPTPAEALTQVLAAAAHGVPAAVHYGRVIAAPSGLLGSAGVHARTLAASAHPGQALASSAAARRLTLPAFARPLGAKKLRDLIVEDVTQLTSGQTPLLKTLDLVRNTLPPMADGFIGRDTELHALTQLLTTQRLLTLTGPGGAGKTRLALHSAACATGFEMILFIDLAPVRSPHEVIFTIASTISRGHTLADLEQALMGRRTLLIIDNFEQVLQARTVLTELSAKHPQVTLLVTSREALDVPEEFAYAVDPLALPTLDDPDPLANPAVLLYLERATTPVAPADLPQIVEAVRDLDGLPLAIELAAARGDHHVGRLMLITAARTDQRTGRQSSLRALIGWSYNQLAPHVQEALSQLTIIPGEFDAPLAAGACHVTHTTLDLLVRKNLLRQRAGADGVYFFLETIRAFGSERITLERQTLVHTRLAEYICSELATPRTFPELELLFTRLKAIKLTTLAALTSAPPAAQRHALTGYGRLLFVAQSWFQEGITLLRPLVAADDAPVTLRSALAQLLRLSHQRDAARAVLDHPSATNDPLCLVEQAYLCIAAGQYQAGLTLLAPARAQTLDAWTRGQVESAAGLLARLAHDLPQAQAAYDAATLACRACADRRGEAGSLNNQAAIVYQRGDLPGARALWEQALPIFTALGNRTSESAALSNIGMCLAEMGADDQVDAAIDYYAQGLAITEEIGALNQMNIILTNLAFLHIRAGRTTQAREAVARAYLQKPTEESRGYLGRATGHILRMEGQAAAAVPAYLDSARAFLSSPLQAVQSVLCAAHAAGRRDLFDEAWRWAPAALEDDVLRALGHILGPLPPPAAALDPDALAAIIATLAETT